MFVEGEVEIKVKDHATKQLDEHDFKLWLQRAFKDLSCYRVSHFRKEGEKTVKAVVALKISVLPDDERRAIEARPNDAALLRGFIDKMFDGKGSCRCMGEPKLKNS